MALSCQINCKILPEYPERGLGLISAQWFRSAIPFLLPSRWKKHQQPCCQDSFKKFRACKQMVPISCAILYFGTYPGTNPKNKSDTPCLNWQAAESCGKFWPHHVWAKADYYTLVGPKQRLRACFCLLILFYTIAPDAGSFWSEHGSQAICLMPHAFDFLPQHLYLWQSEGDKVGDKGETSDKTHKTKARNTNKTMMKLEQDTDTKADIGLETNDFGDRWSTGQVTDKWWKTHKGEQAKEPDIITTKADRWLGTNYKIGKRINWETHGQRHMDVGQNGRPRGPQMLV